MRILVIGSSGFVGTHVINRLVENGAVPIGFDTNTPSQATHGAAPSPRMVQGDMGNLEDILSALIDHGIECVIALGYMMAPMHAPRFSNFIGAAKANVLGVTNIFEACRLAGVRRVVFASSVGVYGPQSAYGDRQITEDDQLSARTLYGRMKMVNESIAQGYARRYDMEIPRVRPAPLLGRGNTMWPARLISPAAVGEPGYAPFSSESHNNLTSVDDLAELYSRIAMASVVKHDVYLATGHNFTAKELADVVRRYLPNATLGFDEDAPPPEYPTIFDNSRAVSEFGWELRSLEDSILWHINHERSAAGLELLT